MGHGGGRATALYEAELFSLLPREARGTGASRSSCSGWETEQTDDARSTEGLEVVRHSTGVSSAVTRVRLRGQGWLPVEAMVEQKLRDIGEEDCSGPSRRVLGSGEAARPESCARMRGVARGCSMWLFKLTAGEADS